MSSSPAPQLGYLIVGHGTRDLVGQAEFREVVRQLAERLLQPVVGAFLELATPTITEGLAQLRQRGVRRVFVAPLLLFSAGHAKEDVPGEVALAASKLGMEVVGQSGALELHPRLLGLSRLRYWEAVGSETNPSGTRLLVVGRGGSDPAALDMLRRYTEALSASLGVVGETAFVALAQPPLQESLHILAKSGIASVVVQPHLLFEGEVSQTINRQLVEARETYRQIRWLLSKHLGPHPLLTEAMAALLPDNDPQLNVAKER